MSRANPAQLEWARRLLAYEHVAGTQDAGAIAAARVYDMLLDHLSPLLGSAGVQALLARSVKLTQSDFGFLETACFESSTALRECLKTQDPEVGDESAAALFGNFLALLTNFIGERLTKQALRRAWPAIDETSPSVIPEKRK